MGGQGRLGHEFTTFFAPNSKLLFKKFLLFFFKSMYVCVYVCVSACHAYTGAPEG